MYASPFFTEDVVSLPYTMVRPINSSGMYLSLMFLPRKNQALVLLLQIDLNNNIHVLNANTRDIYIYWYHCADKPTH
jgi:hypothetical protein